MVTELPVLPDRSSSPTPREADARVSVPLPCNIRLKPAAVTAPSCIFPVPVESVVWPPRVTPVVWKLSGSSLVRMVPVRNLGPTIAVAPPLKVKPAAIVRLPVFAKVTALAAVPAAESVIWYASVPVTVQVPPTEKESAKVTVWPTVWFPIVRLFQD